MMQEQTVTFDPGFYDISSLQEAKEVILGPEKHETVEQRWERETPYLGDLMERVLGMSESSLLLDYGCGVGRMSKEMINRTGCRAVGIDYSANMRALAANYVDSHKFMVGTAEHIDLLKGSFDAAISVWVLQHCLNPIDNIRHIKGALKPGGKFFVLNDHRLIPTTIGFIKDDIDVPKLLNENFRLLECIELSPVLGTHLAPRSYCAVYEKV